jgi:hypothetical protein
MTIHALLKILATECYMNATYFSFMQELLMEGCASSKNKLNGADHEHDYMNGVRGGDTAWQLRAATWAYRQTHNRILSLS